jgi:hypothetical protein
VSACAASVRDGDEERAHRRIRCWSAPL